MRNFLITLFLIITVTACGQQPLSKATSTNAAEKQPTKFEPPEGSMVEENVQVTMRDGIRLNTLVILPPAAHAEKVPTILIRTPYSSEIWPGSVLHKTLLDKGYALIMQHERGRYFSEGKFSMLGGALQDGWDTMDWIVEQPWSDGAIGTFGCSSSAENQLKLGNAKHPAHKAMVIGSAGVGVSEAGPFREQGNFWLGGVWQQGWMNYFHQSMQQEWPQFSPELSNEERQIIISHFELKNAGWNIPYSTYNKTRMHLPMIDIMDELKSPRNEVPTYLRRGPVHPSWGVNRISEGEAITIPALWFESLYDASARSTLAYFEWNRAVNKAAGRDNQKLRLTHGGHCSFGRSRVESEHAKIGDLELGDMRYDYLSEVTGWFDYWLKSTPNSQSTAMAESKASSNTALITKPAYTAYLGDGQWLQIDRLPMQGNQTWHLNGDGTLAMQRSDVAKTFSYQYDPADPVPSIGGEIYGEGDDQKDGSYDQRELHNRQDVLVFTSKPIEQPLSVFGLANVRLTVSSDQPDTDFTVKINEVMPDGRAFNLGQTILRLRYREGLENPVFMTPGQTYKIELPPIPLSRKIDAGHRLQVEVSSSNFPSYARNLNTAADPYTTTETAVATNTIHLGKDATAEFVLPVISER